MSAPLNPPAFPQQCADALDVGMVHEGMSLRDWFAGQALAGMMANPVAIIKEAREFSKVAFELADSMIVVRGAERSVSTVADALSELATQKIEELRYERDSARAAVSDAPALYDALGKARIKLARYREQHGDSFIGGVAAEYDAVVRTIDAALSQALPEQSL